MENIKPLIFAKISAIMADVDVIEKSQKNIAQSYNFRGIDDMYNALHSIFVQHRVFLVSEILDKESSQIANSKGSTNFVTLLTIRYTFYAEDGSNVSTVVQGEGSDYGDKSSNKSQSAALKVALMQMLLIPTKEIKDSEVDSQEELKDLLTKESAKVIKLESDLMIAKQQKPATLESVDNFIKLVTASELTPEKKINSINWAKAGRYQQEIDELAKKLKPKEEPKNE